MKQYFSDFLNQLINHFMQLIHNELHWFLSTDLLFNLVNEILNNDIIMNLQLVYLQI